MITAAIVDADAEAAARLSRLLSGSLAGPAMVEVVGTAGNRAAARRLLRDRRPDVAFVDPKMPGRGGSELLSIIDPVTRIVIVTSDDSFAMAAFAHGAIDYLLKPSSPERLAVTLQRLEQSIAPAGSRPAERQPGRRDDEKRPTATPRQRDAARPTDAVAADATGQPPAAGTPGSPLTIADKVALFRERGRTVELVPVADIIWVEALQNYTRLQLRGGKPIVLKRTLAEWQAILPPDHFGRIGRSLIIQLARLRSTRWQSRDETLLVFEGVENTLPIGRSAAARLKEIFRGGAGLE